MSCLSGDQLLIEPELGILSSKRGLIFRPVGAGLPPLSLAQCIFIRKQISPKRENETFLWGK